MLGALPISCPRSASRYRETAGVRGIADLPPPAPAALSAVPDSRAASTTVIVPTRNEEGNVRELLRRLVPTLPPGSEVVFVDDSDDATPAVIREAATDLTVPVRVHHREPPDRGDGLGGAVTAGLAMASCDWCVVMDADLQHPPELVPALVAAGIETDSQLVVASRYNGAGDAASFSRGRAAMSTWATRLAKWFFPRRLARVSDPMSGFFAVRRDAVDVPSLRPNGFKILLEVAVRCGPLRTTEVPFEFGRRFAGQSKAGLVECARLLGLLASLWFDTVAVRRWSRVVAYGLIGASGLVVNTAVLFLASGPGGLHYGWGAVLATAGSTSWNWAVLELLIRPGGGRRSALRRFGAFATTNVLALLLRVPLMALLIERLGTNYLLANLLSLLILFALRFVVSDTLIFRRSPMPRPDNAPARDEAHLSEVASPDAPHPAPHPGAAPPAPTPDERPAPESNGLHVAPAQNGNHPAPAGGTPKPARRYLAYRYDVPGVATIGSEVPLPELQWFLAPFRTRGPFDIEIRIGRVGRIRRRTLFTATDGSARTYEEHLGSLGANFRLEMGETIRVTAGPLLERSPHVLYTNIVEALLRFLAVAKGHLLLHSACVRLGDAGVMLSARTDTGKTGTILRLIREQGAVFLSDDMTIVDPDGRAHCFPKPLTISQHTLRAVDATGLSRVEWGKLMVQSRLHSKEGRQLGMRLAEHNLPIMTFNALTQALVPPPKYDVDRLVPCDVAQEVDVHELFIIERGPKQLEEVPREQALDELIENTDDAYGFPPFSILAPTLTIAGMDYATLRCRERQLLAQTLDHIRVRRLRRDDFGWPGQISALLGVAGRGVSGRGFIVPSAPVGTKAPNPVYVGREPA